MARRADWTIRPDQRVFACGKTGSGKTVALRTLAREQTRLVVLDSKGTLKGKAWNLTDWNGAQARKLARGEACRIRVPPMLEYESYLWECYKAGNVTVLIDELNNVCPSPIITKYPALWNCLARGREFNVGVWAGVQRPKVLPLNVISEADWLLVFNLQLEADRKRIAEVMGNAAMQDIPDKHGFLLYNAEWREPRYYKGLDL